MKKILHFCLLFTAIGIKSHGYLLPMEFQQDFSHDGDEKTNAMKKISKNQQGLNKFFDCFLSTTYGLKKNKLKNINFEKVLENNQSNEKKIKKIIKIFFYGLFDTIYDLSKTSRDISLLIEQNKKIHEFCQNFSKINKFYKKNIQFNNKIIKIFQDVAQELKIMPNHVETFDLFIFSINFMRPFNEVARQDKKTKYRKTLKNIVKILEKEHTKIVEKNKKCKEDAIQDAQFDFLSSSDLENPLEKIHHFPLKSKENTQKSSNCSDLCRQKSQKKFDFSSFEEQENTAELKAEDNLSWKSRNRETFFGEDYRNAFAKQFPINQHFSILNQSVFPMEDGSSPDNYLAIFAPLVNIVLTQSTEDNQEIIKENNAPTGNNQ